MAKRKSSHYKPMRGLDESVLKQRRKVTGAERRAREKRIEKRDWVIMNEIRQARRDNQYILNQNAEKIRTAFLGAVIAEQTAVLRSYGLSQNVRARLTGWDIKCYTDFNTIVIGWPTVDIPLNESETRLVDDANVLADTVAQIRGAFQHEMGHLLYTVPFAYLNDLGWDDETHGRGYHLAWNLLEDQRMESALVRDVPRIGAYLTRLVTGQVIGRADIAWMYIAGRQYMPSKLLSNAYRLFADSYSQEWADEWLDIVTKYKSATDIESLRTEVKRAKQFMQKVRNCSGASIPSPSTHSDTQRGSSKDEQDPGTYSAEDRGLDELPDLSDSATEQDSTPPAQGATSDEQDDIGGGEQGATADQQGDQQADDSGQGNSDQTDEQSDSESPSQSWTSHVPISDDKSDEFDEQVKQIEQEAKDDILSDSTLHDVVRHANERAYEQGLTYMPHSGRRMPDDRVAVAEQVAMGIEAALTDFVTQSQPTWHARQDQGYIDPLTFMTKEVGSRDFHRRLVGASNEGIDLHVSMMADVSISMEGAPMRALSESVYATARACQNLGIGCSTVLWSDYNETYKVYENGPTAEAFTTLGGTDPTRAMDDLDNHNDEGAGHHLVILFTDGYLNDDLDLSKWSQPNRHIVLVKFGVPDNTKHGADVLVHISDVAQLPQQLTLGIQQIMTI
jgi:hypothetical protein